MEVHDLLCLSKLAYKTPSCFRSAHSVFGNLVSGAEVTFVSSDHDAQYYSIEFANRIIFAMRGTSSIQDAIADAKFIKSKFLGAHVHSGFLQQYDSIASKIIDLVRTRENKDVVFIGHSLGGALATLGAANIKSLFPSLVVKCCTFGSPRVGDYEFSKLFDSTVDDSVRCVNGDDLVTKNPRLFYYHVKGEICVGAKAHWTQFWQTYTGSIEDHYLDNYKTASLECPILRVRKL